MNLLLSILENVFLANHTYGVLYLNVTTLGLFLMTVLEYCSRSPGEKLLQHHSYLVESRLRAPSFAEAPVGVIERIIARDSVGELPLPVAQRSHTHSPQSSYAR